MTLLALIFQFEEVSDNRMFFPGVLAAIILPFAIVNDLRK